MDRRDEELRDAITDRLTQANVDARSLSVEVSAGSITVTGSVPSEEQRRKLASALAGAVNVDCRVDVIPVAPSDSLDGRGRSPLTGTSADSQHESRHQTDKS
ncbi:MAG TPA: BON domain-containing protein [Reyranellaceae bacterium]|nr:BON domain-containing protein [Reyranellaceae bacterium]